MTGYRKKEFGWLLADKEGLYMGVMELGVPPKERAKIYRRAIVKETDDFAYVDPVEVRVKFRNYTKAGLLRLPSFNGWCD
ncbi:hypothetical protein [Mesobacillus boroniphilus]|nr:hypothetical protein [Mesobacillus boroniphilus]